MKTERNLYELFAGYQSALNAAEAAKDAAEKAESDLNKYHDLIMDNEQLEIPLLGPGISHNELIFKIDASGERRLNVTKYIEPLRSFMVEGKLGGEDE